MSSSKGDAANDETPMRLTVSRIRATVGDEKDDTPGFRRSPSAGAFLPDPNPDPGRSGGACAPFARRRSGPAGLSQRDIAVFWRGLKPRDANPCIDSRPLAHRVGSSVLIAGYTGAPRRIGAAGLARWESSGADLAASRQLRMRANSDPVRASPPFTDPHCCERRLDGVLRLGPDGGPLQGRLRDRGTAARSQARSA